MDRTNFSYFSLNCMSYIILSCPWMCLFYSRLCWLSHSNLCCHWTHLNLRQPMLHAHGHVKVQQPVLPLDVSVQQQHLLPLDLLVPALKQTLLLVCVSIADWGLWTRLFSNSICCLWTCVSSLTDCAASGCLFHNSLESLFGLFRFVSKQFCLFRLFRYRFETPKQT